MTDDELVARITVLLATKVLDEPPDDPIAPDDNLFQMGYISSLEILELVENIEAEFGLSIPHYDVSPENFETVRRIAAYLTARLNP
jgi:acyl carrier protein